MRRVSVAFLKCCPFAHARNSFGEDLSVSFVIWMSWTVDFLPAPPPEPFDVVAKLKPRTSVVIPPVNDNVAIDRVPICGAGIVTVGVLPTVIT